MVDAVEPVDVGASEMTPLKGLDTGSRVASTVGSTVTKIWITEPEIATPLVVRLGGKLLWLTRSQTGVLVPPPPPEAALVAATLNGMTSPLAATSNSSGAGCAAPVT